MQITISGHHVSVNESMRSRAYEASQKLFRFFDGITNIAVKMEVDSSQCIAEFTVLARQSVTLTSKAKARDMRKALDEATEKIERQLTKRKEKLHDHRGHGAKRPSTSDQE